MKARFTNRSDFKNQENYTILGYGFNLDNSPFYLIANDNFQIVNLSSKILEIIDNKLDEYVRRDDLNYGRVFYLEKNLNEYHKETENYAFLDNPKANYRYFKQKNYPITSWYKKNVIDEERKIYKIEGFIDCINIYINKKFGKDHYREALTFYKTNDIDELLNEKTEEIINLEVQSYESLLKEFIRNALYDEEIGEQKSEIYVISLFKLIDNLFLTEIKNIQRIQTFYDDCFVIEYEKDFYILNKYWWG